MTTSRAPSPLRLPSGRAGDHGSRAWFVPSGPGIAPGEAVGGHHIRHLVRTASGWLALEPDAAFHGTLIRGPQ